MKRFLLKLFFMLLALVGITAACIWLIPPDRNSYLMAYNVKLTRLAACPQPRIVFIGGSNLAFGLDSQMIQDSLGCNVVNMGLHGGIGARFPVDDCLLFVREGDLVVLQLEYGNYFNGGNGEPETMPQLMVVTGWEHFATLNGSQRINVVAGLPRLAAMNAKRLIRTCLGGNLDTPMNLDTFNYTASGFNQLGDEVSHWSLPPDGIETSVATTDTVVSSDFLLWLGNAVKAYKGRGARVVILPPVCTESHFKLCYHASIERSLHSIGLSFLATPKSMTLDDSYIYNSGYHLNRAGVVANTQHIIALLRNEM